MNLANRERAIQRVCFAREVPKDCLDTLGSQERWLLYRELVRERLRSTLRIALPRTCAALGDELDTWLDRWLDEAPPTTRFIREIPSQFASYVLPQWNDGVAPWWSDLIAFECTNREVRYAPSVASTACDFAFDRRPAVNPASRILSLRYAVHRPTAGQIYPESPTHLVIFRRAADHRTDFRVLNRLAHLLVTRWSTAEETVTASVRTITQAENIAVDSSFLERLAEMLEDFLQAGLLLGSWGSRPEKHPNQTPSHASKK